MIGCEIPMTKEEVNRISFTFFCNSMVEGFYYFVKNGSPSLKLEEQTKKSISELESLKWSANPKAHFLIEDSLFDTVYNVNYLNEAVFDENCPDRLIRAKTLQHFFDNLGDCSCSAPKLRIKKQF